MKRKVRYLDEKTGERKSRIVDVPDDERDEVIAPDPVTAEGIWEVLKAKGVVEDGDLMPEKTEK